MSLQICLPCIIVNKKKYVLVSRAIRKCTLKDIPLENVALTKLLFGAFENKAMHNHWREIICLRGHGINWRIDDGNPVFVMEDSTKYILI